MISFYLNCLIRRTEASFFKLVLFATLNMDPKESLRYLRLCFHMQHHVFLQMATYLPLSSFEGLLNKFLGQEFSIQSINLTNKTTQKEFCWSLMSASQKKSSTSDNPHVNLEVNQSLIENIYSEQSELNDALLSDESGTKDGNLETDVHLASDKTMNRSSHKHSVDTIELSSKYQHHFSELPRVFLIYGLENAQGDIESSLMDLIQRHKIDTSFKMGDSSCYTASFPFSICCILQNTDDFTECKSTIFTGVNTGKEILKCNFDLGRIPLSLRKAFFATFFFSKESLDIISSSSEVVHELKESCSASYMKRWNRMTHVYVSTNIDRYVCKIISCIRMKAAPHGSPSPFFTSLCLARARSFGKNVTRNHAERNEKSDHFYMTEEEWIIHAAKIFAIMHNRHFVTVSDVQTMLIHCLVHKVSHIATMDKFLSNRNGIHEIDPISSPVDVISPEYAFDHVSFALRPDLHLFDSSNLDALYSIQAAFAASNSSVSPFQHEERNIPFAYSTLNIALESQRNLVLGSIEKMKPPT